MKVWNLFHSSPRHIFLFLLSHRHSYFECLHWIFFWQIHMTVHPHNCHVNISVILGTGGKKQRSKCSNVVPGWVKLLINVLGDLHLTFRGYSPCNVRITFPFHAINSYHLTLSCTFILERKFQRWRAIVNFLQQGCSSKE